MEKKDVISEIKTKIEEATKVIEDDNEGYEVIAACIIARSNLYIALSNLINK